jgi:LCP family protein required for cell wall assembly
MEESLAEDVLDMDTAAPKRKRRIWLRVLISAGVFVVVLAGSLTAIVWQREVSYNSNIHRLKGALPTGDRPAAGAHGAENWLLVGSDSRADTGTTGSDAEPALPVGAQRSDTIMLLHLPANRKKAYIISIPRDSWAAIPGHGSSKVNAAFSYGGPALLISTVENLTNVHIDHYAAIDFAGFKAMTNALGGVEVQIAKTTYDPMRNVTWTAGTHKLNGDQALLFVRQRYNLPGGDFDRIKRQQAFLKALGSKAIKGSTLTNPFKLDHFLSAFTKSISVDDTVTAGKLRSLALSMTDLRMSDVSFLTLPVKGTGTRAKQSVVLLDQTGDQALYSAVNNDEMPAYLQQHGGTNSLDTVS